MNRLISISNIIAFITYLSGICGNVNAQVKVIGIDKGLSNNSVTSIYQDKQGFMWFGTYDGLNRFDGYTFKVYKNSLSDSSSLPNNRISCIQEDDDGVLWVGTKSGAYRFRTEGSGFEALRFYSNENTAIQQMTAPSNCFHTDARGDFFVGSAGQGLIVKSKGDTVGKQVPLLHNGERLYQYHVRGMGSDLSEKQWFFIQSVGIAGIDVSGKQLEVINEDVIEANCMLVDADHNSLLIGTNNGLHVLEIRGNTINTSEPEFPLLPQAPLVAIKKDKTGNLWLAFDGHGLYKFSWETKEVKHYYEQGWGGNQLSSDAVYAVYEDRDSRIWIGTLRGGINILDAYAKRFLTVREEEKARKLSRNFILSFCEESPEVIWIGTDGAGLKRWDRKLNQYITFEHQNGDAANTLSNNYVVSLVKDDRFLWIATYGGGVNRLDLKTHQIKRYSCWDSVNQHNNTYAWGLYKDSQNNIWVGTLSDGGTFRYNRNSDRFELVDDQIRNILTFQEDSRGNLWAGNFNQLILVGGREEGKEKMVFDIGVPVRTMLPGDGDCLWIGTEGGGLKNFDTRTHRISTLSESDGMAENVVLNILSDHRGKYWLSTFMGLSEFDPKTKRFRNFYESDGLQSNQFNYNAALKLSTGEMLFGGINGFNIFDPAAISAITAEPRIVVTNVRINNVPLEDYALRIANEGERLSLTYDKAVLSVDFANLEYSFPDKIAYAFWLEGWESNWNYVGQGRSANYGKLPPGNYILHIKATNPDGHWSADEHTHTLHIAVSPPWWRTLWAYVIYGVVALALIQSYLYYRRRTLLLKYEAELAKYEKQQEHALNERKLAFFTHISHELRAPLTLIISPLSELVKRHKGTPDEHDLKPIYKNSKRLLSMVNQLLLFKKIEDGEDRLNVQQLSALKICREVYDCYTQLANQRHIDYSFLFDKHAIGGEDSISGDKEKIEVILFNLLSNAFKYTPDGGKITLALNSGNGNISISVIDSGIGVPETFQNSLFNKFSRDTSSYKSGFGIGLYLVKNYVDMHQGTVRYEPVVSGGSCFTCSFPAVTNHPETKEETSDSWGKSDLLSELLYDQGIESEQENRTPDHSKPIVQKQPVMFLIDDDHEVSAYVKSIFDNSFNVYAYDNALDACTDIEKGLLPGIILCDVMMEEMNGIDFCLHIKSFRHLEAIPIILLTSDVSAGNKLRGISCGADDCIHKPFNVDILVAKVNSLMDKQSKMQTHFYENVVQSYTEGVTEEDAAFISRCEAFILSNLDNEEFNVKSLAFEMGMSHSSFYKKIKQIFKRSASDFIRFIRLRKAAEELLCEGVNVSQAAFSVGYNDVKHFREQFQKEFGMPPSEYVKKYRAAFQKKYQLV